MDWLWFCSGLGLMEGIESLLFSLKLPDVEKEKEGTLLFSRVSEVEEEGAGGGLGCLGPKQACLPAYKLS